MTPAVSTSRLFVAEALGTALLLAIVVGSGIMGARLSGGNDAIAVTQDGTRAPVEWPGEPRAHS